MRVVEEPPLQWNNLVRSTLTPEKTKTTKSKIFHPFLKYLVPYPSIFINASTPKIPANK
jgi:hypothetical protein